MKVDGVSKGSGLCTGGAFSIPIDTTALTEGAHIFTAETSNAASENVTVTRDVTVPVDATSLGWSQSSPYNSTSVTAAWTVSAASDLANQTVQFYTGAACNATSGGSINLSSAVTATRAFTGADGGTYTYKITSVDAAGNATVSACSSSMVIDATSPTIAITTPAASSYINASTDSTTFTVSGTCSESGRTVTVKVDGSTAASQVGGTCDGTNFTSTIDTTGLTAAAHSFTAVISDTAGNSTTSAAVSVTRDVAAPTAATSLGWSQATPTTQTAVTAAWTVSAASDLGNQTIQFYTGAACNATSGGSVDLSSAITATRAFTASVGNTYTYKVTSVDSAGNTTVSSCSSALVVSTGGAAITNVTSSTADGSKKAGAAVSIQVTFALTVTVTGTPQLTLGGVATPVNYTSGSGTNTLTFNYTVASGDNSADLDYASTTALSLNGGTITDSNSVAADLSLFAPGGGSVGAGSLGVNKAIVIDTTAPTIAITSPANGTTINNANQASFAISGTCSDSPVSANGLVVTITATDSIGVVATTTTSCSAGGTFSTNTNMSTLGNGTITTTATITDAATNSTTSSAATFTKAAVTVGIFTPAAGSNILDGVTDSAVLATGFCSENGRVVTVAAGGISYTPTCTGGVWSQSMDLHTLADGAISITANHQSAGAVSATQATRSVTKKAACTWNSNTEFTTAPFNNSCFTGLPTTEVGAVWASGSTIYAGFSGSGVALSTDNGATWSIKTPSQGLGSGLVYWITSDGSGKIFVGTNNGLSISTDSGSTWSNRTTANGLGSNRIYGVAIDANRIYAATSNGVSISTDLTGATFNNYTAGLGAAIVYGVTVDGGHIYAATNGGVSISTDLTSGTFNNKTTGLGNVTVYGVAVDSNYIYAATGGGLSISTDLTGATFNNKTTTNGLATNNSRGVALDSTGRIYVQSSSGVSLSTDGGATFTSKTHGGDWGLFVDRSNDKVYSCSATTGLYISSNQGTTWTTTGAGSTGPGGSQIHNGSIFTTASGNVFMSTRVTNNFPGGGSGINSGKLLLSTDGGISFASLLNKSIEAIFVDASNKIYAADYTSLFISQDGGVNWSAAKTTAQGLGSNTINSIYVDGSGTIYVATNGGVSISTDGGLSFVNHTAGLGSITVNDIYVSGSGVIYAATNGGVSISSDGGATFSNKTNGLGSVFVKGIAVDSNYIYAATTGGVSISTDLTGATFNNKTTAQGLGSNTTYRVAVDNGHIYVTTAGGLSISTDLTGGTFNNKTEADGLSEASTVTAISVHNDKVFVGSSIGGLQFK